VEEVAFRLVGWRPLTILLFTFLGLACVLELTTSILGNGPPPLFTLLCVATYAWNAYWFLYRSAYEIALVDGRHLRWRTLLSRGECRTDEFQGLTNLFLAPGVKSLRVQGQRSPMVWVAAGLPDLAAALAGAAPGARIQVGRADRIRPAFSGTIRWRSISTYNSETTS
jgi:hypothetical protein